MGVVPEQVTLQCALVVPLVAVPPLLLVPPVFPVALVPPVPLVPPLVDAEPPLVATHVAVSLQSLLPVQPTKPSNSKEQSETLTFVGLLIVVMVQGELGKARGCRLLV